MAEIVEGEPVNLLETVGERSHPVRSLIVSLQIEHGPASALQSPAWQLPARCYVKRPSTINRTRAELQG